MNTVKAWHEQVIIPTYEVGTPETYPIFLEKRVYQGSSGSVYPNPVVEKISDEKIDKAWDAIYIENDYIKIMILPALGGRIQMAFDKIRQRHFVYYNQVIKPALVGLTGPWISGGIEFNWPQHHRPSTYDATDYSIEENADGSITVWVSELERMFRTKGMAGFTLYPDKAYLEIKGKLYNRTPLAQTFLWWANPAVAVNEHYQSVFPPDVNAVFDHGKRDVSEFPIAKGEYYKFDYSPGTDISKYKNIPVPTSYMAIKSEYDFVGGYENDTKGGVLHVADHHISPGKKQWTWGNGDFGYAWDRNLTDEDGAYIELMCGVYTDNQPDFSWMQPYEEKSFKQYFIPYYNVGVVKNATKEGMVNLEFNQGKATVKLHVTSNYENCHLTFKSDNQEFINKTLDLDPSSAFEEIVEVGEIKYRELSVKLTDERGNVIVSWQPELTDETTIPEAAKAAKSPNEIDNIEQLYLTGLHLEQYRHATYNPTDYYAEALKREPSDVRNNNAMGLWLLKKGQFNKALPYFDRAIETLTQRNPNPQDGEPFFNRGLALSFSGQKGEAYNAFFKATWNAAWQDAGFLNLAQIDASKSDFEKALELVDKSLIRNWHNHKARHLKVILLRKMNRIDEANALIDDSLKIDNFNFGVLFEKYRISQKESDLQTFKNLIRDNSHNYIEYAIDYAQVGQYETAISLLMNYTDGKSQFYPMAGYFIGYYYSKIGNGELSQKYYDLAAKMPRDYCFPSKLEEVVVLIAVIETQPTDANALYYLGNFWYAARQYNEAQECWEKSVQLNDDNAICHRNLALLYYNKTNEKAAARKHLEHAFSLDPTNARLLMELDQLHKKFNLPVNERLQVLEDNLALTQSRDDLYLELVSLNNFLGNHEKALQLINQRQFHPWEGGEGKVPFQFITANVELAKQRIKEGNFEAAIAYLEAAQVYPHNLGEGKLAGAQENDINYWLGNVYQQLGNCPLASQYWIKAAHGLSSPTAAIFYNDQQPDKIFYQGMALLKLEKHAEAQTRFENLINYGQQHMNDDVKLDYFAVSLPDLLIWEEDLSLRNKIHCNYLIGLGELGFGNLKQANEAFDQVFSEDLYHLPALVHQRIINENVLVTV